MSALVEAAAKSQSSKLLERDKVTPDLLRDLLKCDPINGKLFWRERERKWFATDRDWKKWNTRYAGKEAFTSADRYGYPMGSIFKKPYRAHRIIWTMQMGAIPDGMEIDHINGVCDDNRISNLRIATVSENRSNARTPSNNTSGVKGVHWDKANRKWAARTKVNGEIKYLGYFINIADAESAYLSAVEKYKGRFAYHNRGKEI